MEFDEANEDDDSKSEGSDDSADNSEFITINMTQNRLSPSSALTHGHGHGHAHGHAHGHGHGHGKPHNTDNDISSDEKSSPPHPANEDHNHIDDHDTGQSPNTCRKYSKMVFLLISWLVFTSILTSKDEKHITLKQIVVSANQTKSEFFFHYLKIIFKK